MSQAMTDLPPARTLLRRADRLAVVLPAGRVTLGYDARFLRRKRLRTDAGVGFLLDLPETVSVNAGDCFVLDDGRLIEIAAAEEPVLIVTGDLARLAWHIGNRHTPCQIEAGRLLIRRDHVLEAMLRQLGAGVAEAVEPFTPEGGAYGHGRTMGHDHGPGHDHPHPHPHPLALPGVAG
jgi:urease accessory protein